MRKHIVYNTVNFQPVTFRILFFRGIQTLQMRLSREACFWWTQLLRPFCRAADELLYQTTFWCCLVLNGLKAQDSVSIFWVWSKYLTVLEMTCDIFIGVDRIWHTSVLWSVGQHELNWLKQNTHVAVLKWK